MTATSNQQQERQAVELVVRRFGVELLELFQEDHSQESEVREVAEEIHKETPTALPLLCKHFFGLDPPPTDLQEILDEVLMSQYHFWVPRALDMIREQTPNDMGALYFRRPKTFTPLLSNTEPPQPRDFALLKVMEYLTPFELVVCTKVSHRWRRAALASHESWLRPVLAEERDVQKQRDIITNATSLGSSGWQVFLRWLDQSLDVDAVWSRMIHTADRLLAESGVDVWRQRIPLRGVVGMASHYAPVESPYHVLSVRCGTEKAYGMYLWGDAELDVFRFPRSCSPEIIPGGFTITSFADACMIAYATLYNRRVPDTPDPRYVRFWGDSKGQLCRIFGSPVDSTLVFGPERLVRVMSFQQDGNTSLFVVELDRAVEPYILIDFGTS